MRRVKGMTLALVVAFAFLNPDAPSFADPNEDEVVPKSPKDGGPRRFIVTGGDLVAFDAPDTDAKAVLTLADKAVLSNLGCVQPDDLVWCEVRPNKGGPRGFVPAHRLAPAIGPDGTIANGLDDSKTRARKRQFDANAQVMCAQEQGQQLALCDAAIARSDGGDATVVVTFGNGFTRDLYFGHGAFLRANTTMSGVGTDTSWQLSQGTHLIRVDDQRFEISNGFILGQ